MLFKLLLFFLFYCPVLAKSNVQPQHSIDFENARQAVPSSHQTIDNTFDPERKNSTDNASLNGSADATGATAADVEKI